MFQLLVTHFLSGKYHCGCKPRRRFNANGNTIVSQVLPPSSEPGQVISSVNPVQKFLKGSLKTLGSSLTEVHNEEMGLQSPFEDRKRLRCFHHLGARTEKSLDACLPCVLRDVTQ
ncbi:hypothetical protein NFI96_005364 [Prochilodus magdalenae]|nr:hypothetical protein NFI96_005364 [Prochilodus magdalenae]